MRVFSKQSLLVSKAIVFCFLFRSLLSTRIIIRVCLFYPRNDYRGPPQRYPSSRHHAKFFALITHHENYQIFYITRKSRKIDQITHHASNFCPITHHAKILITPSRQKICRITRSRQKIPPITPSRKPLGGLHNILVLSFTPLSHGSLR